MLLPLVIGAAALGFIAFRRRHRWHRHAFAHGFGRGGGCHDHHGHQGHHGWRGRGGPYYVMATLDTSPAQEKVIREEFARLRERGRVARDEAFAARGDLAEVLRGETFDRARFDAAASRIDGIYAGLKGSFAESLARVHETLDARQREALAELLASKRGPGFGPFR